MGSLLVVTGGGSLLVVTGGGDNLYIVKGGIPGTPNNLGTVP